MKKALFLSVLGVLLVHNAWSQNDNNPNLNQEVIAVGERELQVKEVFKQSFFPTEQDTVVRKKDSEYGIDPVIYKTQYIPDTIIPANLRILEPLNNLNRFYARAGLGLYTTSIVDVYYNSLRNRKTGMSIAYNHRASAGGINGLPNDGAFSDNKIAAQGRYNSKNLTGQAGIEFQSMVRHLIQPEFNDVNLADQINDPKTSHEFIRTFFKSELLQNRNRSVGVELNGDFNYTTFYDSNEIGFFSEALVKKQMGNEVLQASFGADYNQFGEDALNRSTILSLSPSVATQTDKFTVKAGLSVQANISDGNSNFSFFPDIAFKATLWQEYATPYVSFTGAYQRNSLNDLLQINPYLSPNVKLRNSREKINLLVGSQFTLGSKLALDLNFRYQNTDDALFFARSLLSSGEESAIYSPIYDGLKQSTISANINFILNQSFSLNINNSYFRYNTDSLVNAYYQPELTSEWIVQYNYEKKFLVNLGLSFIGPRTAGEQFIDTGSDVNPGIRIRAPRTQELGAYADLSLGFEYRYNRRLSAFINFSNVLNADYQVFDPYQAQRFGVLGGLTYTF